MLIITTMINTKQNKHYNNKMIITILTITAIITSKCDKYFIVICNR